MENNKNIVVKDYQAGVDNLLDQRDYFVKKVSPILEEKQDYFTILNKKSLAKGGAEKLATIFGYSAQFQVDKETVELLKQEGLVAYVCNLYNKEGTQVGQGRGADSLSRNKSDANKTIKMAQKRAYVDAVIRTTGLSDIFTQDLEDMDLNGNGSSPKENSIVEPVTQKNINFEEKLSAHVKKAGDACTHCGAQLILNPKTGKVFCKEKCWLKKDEILDSVTPLPDEMPF